MQRQFFQHMNTKFLQSKYTEVDLQMSARQRLTNVSRNPDIEHHMKQKMFCLHFAAATSARSMSSFGTYLGICRDCQPHREVHEEGRATLNHITAVTLLNLQYQYKLLFIGMLYRDVCLYNMSVCVLFVLVSRYKVHLEHVGQVAPGLIPENFFLGMFGIAQCFSTFIPYLTTLHYPPGKYHQKIILG